MDYLYGHFTEEQIEHFKKQLHNKIHWLILYKDPMTKEEYPNVDYNKYFISLMLEIDGLNALLLYPPEIVEMICILQSAYIQTKKDIFDYRVYRKLILDAHSLVDKL